MYIITKLTATGNRILLTMSTTCSNGDGMGQGRNQDEWRHCFFLRCTLPQTHETLDAKHVLSVRPSSSVFSSWIRSWCCCFFLLAPILL